MAKTLRHYSLQLTYQRENPIISDLSEYKFLKITWKAPLYPIRTTYVNPRNTSKEGGEKARSWDSSDT